MLAVHENKNINYVRIVGVLKALRDNGNISYDEYARATAFYKKLTGADIVLAE